MDIRLRNETLYLFLEKFWFAPNDAFLRAVETSIWEKQEVKHPILDIGCGDGRNDRYLFKPFLKIDVGIDINKKALEKALKSKVYKKVLFADASNLPFKKEMFNSVIANSTFEHITYDIKAVSEVGRVLKKGGSFIFSVPTPRFEKYFKKFVIKKEELKKYNKRVEHLHYRKLDEWKKILSTNNLVILDFIYYFPKDVLRIWYLLHKITVFKPYRRELWSYLKDSRYGNLLPKNMIASLYKTWLKKYFRRSIDKNGAWIFIVSVKK